MESKVKDIGIAYFTNPAILNEPFGKEIDGIMVSVAKQVPVRKVDTYKENGIFLWDIAAGAALVKSAGGTVSISELQDDFRVDARFSNSVIQE